MRQDSWFRGTLLSVLFFAVLIGGTPGMAVAGAGACVDAGGHWDVQQGCLPMSESSHCKAMDNVETAAETAIAAGAAIAAVGVFEPSPFLEMVGVGIAGLGAAAWLLNKVGQKIAGC